jgi:SET domain-containing protein 6
LTYPPDEIPEATIAFARLLLEEDVWEKARDKGKVPKPKVETTESGLQVLDVLLESCAIRMRTYTCSIESDLAALSSGGLEKYDFMARVVRTGELRVLAVTRAILNKQRDELYAKLTVPAKGNKRKAENLSKGGKKSKSSGGK